ncbi:DUF4124 domain-containing protein [Polaromonas sp. CG_9.5]|uniref:DUF4124 domain-containing protein n=1 Tax=Polaromonas sp. CG_9.5 TaxID=3071705 RepID=UPI002E1454FF
MDFKSFTRNLILLVASTSCMHAALAQWQWIDKDGRKVFSDRAPPAEIPEKNILKQPGLRAPLPAADADAAPAAAAPLVANKAGTPKIPGKDTQLEARKKQAEDEENAKKKAEEEKLAKSRADNCERAKKGLVAVQSGTRLSVINAKGEREFMDDNERAKETKRLQGIADSDCQK